MYKQVQTSIVLIILMDVGSCYALPIHPLDMSGHWCIESHHRRVSLVHGILYHATYTCNNTQTPIEDTTT